MTDMKRDQDHRAVLDAERAVNEQYLKELERRLAEQSHLFRQITVVQSHAWTNSSLPRPSIDRGATAAVIGRVALEGDHPCSDMLGQTFYIAGRYVKTDGFEAINWAAPIASLYFEGRSSAHEIASAVTGRRTFVLQLNDLIDYSDEIETDVADPFAGQAQALEVPEPPKLRRPPIRPSAEDNTRQEPKAAELDGPPPVQPTELFVTEVIATGGHTEREATEPTEPFVTEEIATGGQTEREPFERTESTELTELFVTEEIATGGQTEREAFERTESTELFVTEAVATGGRTEREPFEWTELTEPFVTEEIATGGHTERELFEPTEPSEPTETLGPPEPSVTEAIAAEAVATGGHTEREPTESFVVESVGEVGARRGQLRAADAVDMVMRMPKSGRMGVVLPTMQPDQYLLVAASGNRGLVVQGQPGTGKTVVAAHRAVYLTSEARKSERITRVAMVGPSDQYVEHVVPVISELKEPESEIQVLSLPALLHNVVGLSSIPKPGPIGRIESSWNLGRVIDGFVKSMADRPTSGRMEQRVRRVVEAMKQASESEMGNSEILVWLRALPNWNEIAGRARYLPMLATVALSLDPGAIGERVGHLVVDEAQDVRDLEWRILTSRLLEHGGSLSLFGDMNQRRSDWTATDWQTLAENLEMTDDTGYCNIQVLQNGYRSTRQILRFANQLLPRGERGEQALRDGPHPTVTKVPADERRSVAVDAAIDLTDRHTGMVAVISTEPRPLTVEFRARGWARGHHQQSWSRNGVTISVLHPDEARGLEFDAAVVVEPGDFPKNVGRQGVLYTSLTRANKELTIVHSRPFPRGLRPPRR